MTVTDSTKPTAQSAQIQCTIIINPPPITLACASNPTGTMNVPYSGAGPAITGGIAPFTYSATGLPAGLSINPTTGAITGTPTAYGSFNYTVTVTDSTKPTAQSAQIQCTIVINPPPVANCIVINAVQGLAIAPVTLTGSGGSGGPYTFSATGLPAGLSISTTGTISGIPAVSGTFSYTVIVQDNAGHVGTSGCSVTIVPPGTITVKKVTNPSTDTTTSFSFAPSYGSTFNLKNGGSNTSAYLVPGNYSVSEIALAGWTLTTAICDNGDVPSAITLAAGQNVTCTFTNTQMRQGLAAGDTATIGFWHNKNGQAVINSFNGGSSATGLGNWLAANFPNLFGASNPYTSKTLASFGHTSLAGLTNAQVATVYLNLWTPSGVTKNTYVQAFAGALACYATNPALGYDPTAASFGFNSTPGGTCGKTFNVGSNGAAFGVPNGTTLSISQVLAAANANFTPSTGLFFGGDQTRTSALNNVLNGINTTGDII